MCAGQEVEVDLEKDVLTVLESGKQYALKSIGEVRAKSTWCTLWQLKHRFVLLVHLFFT
jgi:hypothetical protein